MLSLPQLGPMLKVKKLLPDATLPTVAHPGEDIGYDLYSCEEVSIDGGSMAGVRTGIAIEFVPAGGGVVKTRSGMARKRLMCNAGVIDAGYRGEIIVIIENLGPEPYVISKGDKIAQLLEHPFPAGEVREDELNEAARGDKGFGSSGS
jgi:dUTP pyrophosphatase